MKLASVVALAGLLVFAGSARAQLSGSVRLSADTTDAPVESIATNGARTLVAGRDLSRVQHATRGGAIVSAVSGQPLALVQDVEDVHRVIPAPDGGWYVAAQDKVMRLRADGSVDAAFGVVLGDGESPGDARSLALSPDGVDALARRVLRHRQRHDAAGARRGRLLDGCAAALAGRLGVRAVRARRARQCRLRGRHGVGWQPRAHVRRAGRDDRRAAGLRPRALHELGRAGARRAHALRRHRGRRPAQRAGRGRHRDADRALARRRPAASRSGSP